MAAVISAQGHFHRLDVMETHFKLTASVIDGNSGKSFPSGSVTISRHPSELQQRNHYNMCLTREHHPDMVVHRMKIDITQGDNMTVYRGSHSFEETSKVAFSAGIILNESLEFNVTLTCILKQVRKPPMSLSQSFRFHPPMPFADLILKCQDTEVSCHKVIIALHSNVFRTMLQGDYKEAKTGVVDLKDIEPETLKFMVQWHYTKKVPRDADLLIKLFRAADRFDTPDLRRICETVLKLSMCTDSASEIFELADSFNLINLRQASVDFIHENYHEVCKSEGE